MHQGRGGMGSHKHGISGRGGSPPGLKQRLAREQIQRSKERAETRKRHRQPMYNTIRELMARR
jgi:hypothetical protein